MMKYLCHKFVLLLTVTLILPFWGVGGSTVLAQGQDPTLAAMILLYTNKAKKELKQQEEMMLRYYRSFRMLKAYPGHTYRRK